jgi:hypothetical protein
VARRRVRSRQVASSCLIDDRLPDVEEHRLDPWHTGEATLVEHRSERPIAITWRLHRPMPPEVLQQGTVASG